MNEHEIFIHQTHELAINAGKKGNHTFGALLVNNNKVILSAENTVQTEKDTTRHAELNLIVKAERELPLEILRQCTLYTSTAPCLMCTAVIWNAGISKLVFSVSYEAFAGLIPDEYKYISCDEVYSRLNTPLELVGPILEDDGLLVYDYWQSD